MNNETRYARQRLSKSTERSGWELYKLLDVDASGFHQKEQAFISRLKKHKQSVFTFLLYTNVPPDNNAERAIRNVKVKTKTSSQFRKGKEEKH
jgi:hypothetical protein